VALGLGVAAADVQAVREAAEAEVAAAVAAARAAPPPPPEQAYEDVLTLGAGVWR
jgi:pyruvate dehydrogenase E1 component alpha subunit